MKKTVLISISIFISVQVYGQKTSVENIPKPAVEAFDAAYPWATKVEWGLDEENFEADFVLDRKEKSAYYNAEGKWLRTETPIRVSDVPKIIKQAAYKNFKGCKIIDPVKIETNDNGTLYEMDLAKDNLMYEITINDAGNMIKHKEKEGTKKKNKTEDKINEE